MSSDDFVEIVKLGLVRAPCTMKCSEYRTPRNNKLRRRVSLSFRTSLLEPDVVEVLRSPRLSAAYSPSQRVVRVRGGNHGDFQLVRAPKTADVYILRFPYQEQMPWVPERVAVGVDYNETQRAVFLEIPGVTPQRPDLPALPAPSPAARQVAEPEKWTYTVVPVGLNPSNPLTPEEAALLSLLTEDARHTKESLMQCMQEDGHGRVSVNGLLGKIRYKLMDLGVEPTESTDRTQVWLSPMAHSRLRELVMGAAR